MNNIDHNLFQLCVYLLKGPGKTLAVLAHFQSRSSHAACICCLCRSENHAVLLQIIGSLQSRRHISALAHGDGSIFHKCLCIFQIQLILRCARKGDVCLYSPYTSALMVLGVRTILLVLCQTRTVYFLNLLQRCHINSIRIIYPPGGIGTGKNLNTKLLCLLNCVNSYISGTGDNSGLSGNINVIYFQKFLRKVQKTIAGCLCSCKRSAVAQTLSGKNPFVAVTDSLVLSEKESDLAAANTDITGRYICVCADMTVKLCHKALAECHNLPVRFSLRIKIRSAFAASDRKSGQGIFENLLKSEEFNNSDIYRRMEPKAALVRSDGAVKLNTVSCVYLNLSIIIYPRNTKTDLTFRLTETLEKCVLSVKLFVSFRYRTDSLQEFFHCLMKFGLRRIFCDNFFVNFIYISHLMVPPCCWFFCMICRPILHSDYIDSIANYIMYH